MDCLSIITNVLDEMGLVVIEANLEDYNLQDYIIDSLQYIDFIVRIEEKLEVQLPDDFFNLDLLVSSKAFALKISDYMANS